MDSNTVMGIVVACLATLIGLFITLATPIIKLNKTIQKLDDNLTHMKEELKSNSKEIEELEDKVHEHSQFLTADKLRLDNHEERLTVLEKTKTTKTSRSK